MPALLRALGAAVLIIMLAGCSRTASSDLKITYNDGAGTVKHWTLTCGMRPGGSIPDPQAACAALDKNAKSALPPVPHGKACSMIYGGPQKATITGTWKGEPVDARFSRVNGCETARWAQLKGLLP